MILRKNYWFQAKILIINLRCNFTSKSPVLCKGYGIKQKKAKSKETTLDKIAFPPHLKARIEKWKRLLEKEMKCVKNMQLKKTLWDDLVFKYFFSC